MAFAGRATAAGGVDVYVGYADDLRASPTNFPTPWDGSPGVTFEGCTPPSTPCQFDAGAVRVVNNSATPVTVDSVSVNVGGCIFTNWPSASLAIGGQLIVTQVTSGADNGCVNNVGATGPPHMDTSDVGPGGGGYAGNCTPDGIIPTVDVKIDGVTTSYNDSGRVINTGGFDLASCPEGTSNNESTQWSLIGTAPCTGSSLTLAPPSQTHAVGDTATVTATFENSCQQPLQGAKVDFTVLSGPNAGVTGSGVTDSSGQASFSYSGLLPGTDTVQASITNPAGTIFSNTVNVIWTLPFAAGGAFVIGDKENVPAANVLWWGSQWWKANPMTSGSGPASFKGFENSNASPTCGRTWTTDPGNSSGPPATVPPYMGVIVSSKVTKSGSTISGDIVHIVVVKTDPGYAPNPGHDGTGTIVAKVC
jgi:hypothetical protein